MRFLSSRHRVLDRFGGHKDAKIDQKSNLDDDQNEESEKVDFLYPSHAKSHFSRYQEGQYEAPKPLLNAFYKYRIGNQENHSK